MVHDVDADDADDDSGKVKVVVTRARDLVSISDWFVMYFMGRQASRPPHHHHRHYREVITPVLAARFNSHKFA